MSFEFKHIPIVYEICCLTPKRYQGVQITQYLSTCKLDLPFL